MSAAQSGIFRRAAIAGAVGAALSLVTLGVMAADAPAAAVKSAKPGKAAKPVAAPAYKPIVEAKAMALLKASSERLAAAKSMAFTATASYEYPSKLGPAIVYTVRYDVSMQRPDRLRIVVPGDGPASEFYYDGKALMAFVPTENLVAVAEAPPTIDAMLKQAYQKAGIFFPFTDLVAADPFAALSAGVKSAFYVGPSGVVGGVKTDMVVWADNEVFLQFWIGADDKLPRRVRAVYRADPLRLRHDLELSNWQLDVPMAPETFVSEKAKTADRIPFAHPMAPPPGVKPLGVGKAAKGGKQ
jgi:hypothetical protein